MKKNKKKNDAPIAAEEKGQATQEMEAIMDAAASDTADIDLLLDENAPKEDTVSKEPDTDGIDDIPDALEETSASEDSADETAAPAAEAPAAEGAAEDDAESAVPLNDAADDTDAADDEDDDLQPTEPAPDEEVHPAEEDKAEESADYKNLGLYLHIPFCKSKCAYCDFYSSDKIVCQGRKTPEEMKLYCTALKNNMRIIS